MPLLVDGMNHYRRRMRTNTGVTARPFAGMLAAKRTASLVLAGTWIAALCVCGCGKDELGGPGPLPPPPAPPPSPAPPLTMVNFKGYVGDRLNYPLATVTIDLVDGPQTGETSVTGADGRFAFPEPVELPVTLRLKRDGYTEKQELIQGPWKLQIPHHLRRGR